jgi:hypothetical protein
MSMRLIYALIAAALIGIAVSGSIALATAQTAGQIVAPTIATTSGSMQTDAIHNNADREKKSKTKTPDAPAGPSPPVPSGPAPK